MTFTALSIITLVLAFAAVVATFVPRMPSAVASFAALVCAHFAGAVYVDAKVIIFWGVATAIVLGLRILQPSGLVNSTRGHGYVALGTLAGVLLGYVCSPVAAALILGGCAGAFLGAVAFMRTPAGQLCAVTSQRFIDFLCAKGLPCVVTTSMAAISVASLII